MDSFLNTSYTHSALVLIFNGQIFCYWTTKIISLNFKPKQSLSLVLLKGYGPKKFKSEAKRVADKKYDKLLAPKMDKKIKISNAFL